MSNTTKESSRGRQAASSAPTRNGTSRFNEEEKKASSSKRTTLFIIFVVTAPLLGLYLAKLPFKLDFSQLLKCNNVK
jgi:hypothetical protein